MADKVVGDPWDEECESALNFIICYGLTAEQIAYKFKRKEIGYICEYLGLPYDQSRKELDSARMLLNVLKDVDYE